MILAMLLAALPPLQLDATTFKLDNGMTVILSPDHGVPGVTVDIWYHVGSKDEEKGRTGFAHLFEHLMFMGARYVPYPQFDTIMEAAGGSNNASTWNDSTHYHESGPSNLLETFLWMEADRMDTLGQEIDQKKLDTQRGIVLNERRQSYENQPYGKAELLLYPLIFPEGHPYHWPVIGSSQDLEAAKVDDVQRFFAKWYVPANASLAIVGDFDVEKARALVERYFGWIPGGQEPQRVHPGKVELTGETRASVQDEVELPRLTIAWPSPAAMHPGDAECDLIQQVIGRGKASRLYTKLVHELQIAAEVTASQENLELQSVFRIDALARPGHTTKELQTAIDAELQRFLDKGPTQGELASARIGLYTGEARGLEGLLARAELLNRYQFYFGNPTAWKKDLGRYEDATPAGVQEWARRVLLPERVVLETQPKKKEVQQ